MATEGIGDIVASVAQPIAKGIDHIFGTDLQNCGGCKKRQQQLNELTMPLQPPQSTKAVFTLTFNPDFIIGERRGAQGLETKVIPRDDKVTSAVGEWLISFAPPKQDNAKN